MATPDRFTAVSPISTLESAEKWQRSACKAEDSAAMSYTGMRGVFHRCRQTAPSTMLYLRIRFFLQIHLPCQMALCGTSQFPLQG